MTHDAAIPAQTRGFLMYTWDAPHNCGITSRCQYAIDQAYEALSAAEIGTRAVICSGPPSGELPKRVIGYAERVTTGVTWNFDT